MHTLKRFCCQIQSNFRMISDSHGESFFFYSDKRSFPSFLFNAVPWRHVCNISDYYSTSSL